MNENVRRHISQNFVISCPMVSIQFFANYNKRRKDTYRSLIKKAHERKGKSLTALNVPKYFLDLAENSQFVANQFFQLHFYNWTVLLQF